ncbi:Smr/MutS family protein [Mailhella sp.]|uniref:Smr/MutS family protein n=1 Tax=Mailhella sp. TaxID=1981029 RepID=UPI003AB898E1
MSKDASNPFSMLNARDFPSRSERDNSKKQHRAKTVVKNKDAEAASQDADAEMFLEAMGGNVRALSSPDGASSGRRGVGKPMKEKSSDKADNDSFARALESQGVKKMLRKKSSREMPAPSTPEPEKEETPATLTAMALAGARIGRGDEASPLNAAVGQGDDADESRDFFSAIKGTVPLNGKGRDVPVEPEPPAVPVTDPRHPLQDFMEGKVEFSVASTDEYAEGHVVGLDLMIVSQLQSRQFSPEAHIDLHGLNCEQAFQNLVGFFRNAYYKGARTVLVVTGRGLNSLNGVPILRSRVQQWLTQDPFKRVVLAFCTAKQEDGGAGAFYVLIRKRKKSYGKIRWDVMPSDPDLYS